MKIVYILLFIVLCYFTVVYGRYWYFTNYSNLPDITHEELKLGSGPELRYIAAGDSTAVGEGASNVSKTYPNKIWNYLAQNNSVEYKNVAVIGATTKDVIDKQLAEIIDFNPDIVTISIGANDTTHLVSKNMILENFQSIIKNLSEKTHAKIYITDVPRFDHSYLLPVWLRNYFDHQAKATNPELLKLGTKRVKIIDIHSIAVDNSADRFHPSDQGYTFWTQAFLDQIKIDF